MRHSIVLIIQKSGNTVEEVRKNKCLRRISIFDTSENNVIIKVKRREKYE